MCPEGQPPCKPKTQVAVVAGTVPRCVNSSTVWASVVLHLVGIAPVLPQRRPFQRVHLLIKGCVAMTPSIIGRREPHNTTHPVTLSVTLAQQNDN